MYFPLYVGVLCTCLSLFWYALFCVLSSFAIILERKRELVALLLLSYGCHFTINVLSLPPGAWVGLGCVSVVFPDHINYLLGWQSDAININSENRYRCLIMPCLGTL